MLRECIINTFLLEFTTIQYKVWLIITSTENHCIQEKLIRNVWFMQNIYTQLWCYLMFFTLQSRQLCIKSSEYYVWASLHKLCMCYYTVIWEKSNTLSQISHPVYLITLKSYSVYFYNLSFISLLFIFRLFFRVVFSQAPLYVSYNILWRSNTAKITLGVIVFCCSFLLCLFYMV